VTLKVFVKLNILGIWCYLFGQKNARHKKLVTEHA